MQQYSPEVQDLYDKYRQRLKDQLNISPETFEKPIFSREYQEFKKAYVTKKLGWYEKLCSFSEMILRLKPDQKKFPDYEEAINISHLNVTPSGALSFSIFIPLMIALIGSLVSFILIKDMFFVFFFVFAGIILIKPFGNLIFYFANSWRMKASNQMVLCIFYVATYMRHTSNLELAIEFAAEHLAPPLSLDLKKVLWDIETEKYESIKESLDNYLETWRRYNIEFIESFHLIESSLYEPSNSRRLTLLDKSLDVILSETYEKMLHYAHNLKSPITMLHMLGIILPILGLVILPLVVNFIGEVSWYHLALLYNISLPIAVYFLGKSILSKRPTGYGDTDISEENPELKKYRSLILNLGGYELKISPMVISIFVGVILFLIGISPLIMRAMDVADFGIGGEDSSSPCLQKFCMLDYRQSRAAEGPNAGKEIGPFGLGAGLLSLFIVLSIGLSMGIYYRFRSKNIIKIRNQSKKLEDEFASALFQLGNRIGDGLPAELAVGKVAEIMKDTVSGNFFELVSMNIRRLGMSVEEAIFNKKTGALVSFPSKIIESSMKVLIQSIKKGPQVATQALMNVSRYIKEIHSVNERLKDLMAEIIASMKSQIVFLAPAISGIVVGITSMVTAILGKLTAQLSSLTENLDAASMQTGVLGLFGDGIPIFYFQLIVGIYVVQVIYILTILTNGIENGADKLAEKYALGQNMVKSIALYCIVSAAVMILFNVVAGKVILVTSVAG